MASADVPDPESPPPTGGKGGDKLAAAIEEARGELSGVVKRLVSASKAPDRQTAAVVSACNAIIALACRDVQTGAPEKDEQAEIVSDRSAAAVRAELTARSDAERQSKQHEHGEYDA